ncbi:MAG: BlaI/MecI/CopY family transcriptional regulator [Nanoarchaeota archaeon]|nr:BlaI/MecI/CopY family transcriptional regulator [Nanoarchaeota archaeon]
MNTINENLKKAGLTGNEAKVYYALLQRDPSSANEVAKKISMDRSLTYTVLNNLIEKGFVSYVIKGKKKYFQATPPEIFLTSLKKQEFIVTNLVTTLNKIKKVPESDHEIRVYEGKEGSRTFMRLLSKQKDVCTFGATGRTYDLLYESPTIVKDFEKKGFTARIITNPKYKTHPMTKIKNAKIKYLRINSDATTTIFGDYVGIHILTQKPVIILIRNKEIARSYKNHFEVLWEASSAKP